jgi:SAM-dependent methyltransferase
MHAAAIAWCCRNLPFAEFRVNGLRPPLPYAVEQFALVYALSVFTHLPEELQRPWFEELARVLVPGGHLLVSVHGDSYLPDLSEDEQRLFRAGDLVVREGPPGSNSCGAYHPRSYLNRVLAHRLSLLEVEPEGARGNPPQDLVILRKI